MTRMMISSATPAEETGDATQEQPQEEGQENTEQADGQRDARTEKDAREHVMAQGIASQDEKRHEYIRFRSHPKEMDIAWE